MVLLSGRRCARLCHSLLVAVVLLAGHRHAVLGEDVMDSSKVSVRGGGIWWDARGTVVEQSKMTKQRRRCKGC